MTSHTTNPGDMSYDQGEAYAESFRPIICAHCNQEILQAPSEGGVWVDDEQDPPAFCPDSPSYRHDPDTAATPQQIELDEAVQHLAKVLARVIPSTTAHYAVEETRRALRRLAPLALTVVTVDATAQTPAARERIAARARQHR